MFVSIIRNLHYFLPRKKYTTSEIRKKINDKKISRFSKPNTLKPRMRRTKRKIKKLKPKKSTQKSKNLSFFKNKLRKTEKVKERSGTQTISGIMMPDFQ